MLEDARNFIARVIALPADGERAFIGIHYTRKPKDHPKGAKLPFGSGKIAHDPDDAVQKIQQITVWSTTKDIYVCMGTQDRFKEKENKYTKETVYIPNKERDNILRLITLFIDTDFIKGGEHGYKTQEESEKAFAKFLADTGIPEPSIINNTGGGFHIYWVLAAPLSVPDWQPLANALAEATRQHGFKCDTNVTVDASRILRVPGTLNHKYTPAKTVRVVKWIDRNYTVEEMTTALSKYAGVKTTTVVTTSPELTAFKGVKPFINFQSTEEMTEMQAGILMSRPIDIEEARKECLFIDDALATGGTNLSGQPAWNIATLLATFTIQGRQAAHDMAKNNQYYNATDQDTLYDRKEKERQAHVGWPKCSTVQREGSTQCTGCPHLSKDKYPFSFINQVVTPAVTMGLPVFAAPPLDTIPDAYKRDQYGMVYRVEVDEDGDAKEFYPSDTTIMTNGSLSTDPFTLHFSATVAPHMPARGVSVQVKDIGNAIVGTSNSMADVLTAASVKVSLRKEMGLFLMAWVDKLKANKETFSAYPSFGWALDDARKIVGFTYGGKVHTPYATLPSGRNDVGLVQQYTPQGSLDEWRKAALLVTNTKRPAMDAILASAFAGPLVFFTGEQGLYFSAYSEASGIGKTTAMRIATSVYADPNSAMHTLQDTIASVQHKMGILRHIPVVWDELKGDEALRKMAIMIFQHMQGKERNRLTSTIEQRHAGQWATMLITASNDSLADHLDELAKGNEAGIYRLFELKASAAQSGVVSPSEAAMVRTIANEHFGVAGLLYSQFLGTRYEMVRKIVFATMDKFQKEAKTTEAERFWLCTPVCLYLGAEFANSVGLTNIDVPALKDALFEQIEHMRASIIETPRVMADTVISTLIEYLRIHHKRILQTNDIWDKRGPPIKNAIRLTLPVKLETLEGPLAQYGEKTQTLRIAQEPLREWLLTKKISRNGFIDALKFKLGAVADKKSIGTGVLGVMSWQQRVVEIDCSPTAAHGMGPMFVAAIDPANNSNVIQGNFGGGTP